MLAKGNAVFRKYVFTDIYPWAEKQNKKRNKKLNTLAEK